MAFGKESGKLDVLAVVTRRAIKRGNDGKTGILPVWSEGREAAYARAGRIKELHVNGSVAACRLEGLLKCARVLLWSW